MAKKEGQEVAMHAELASKILTETEKMVTEYTDDAGELIIDKTTLRDMTRIIQEGVALNNYIIEHELYKENQQIQELLGKLGKDLGKLEMTEANAKKLDFGKGLKTWAEVHGLVVALSIAVLQAEYPVNA